LKEVEEFTSWAVLQAKEEFTLILEGIEHPDNERMFNFDEYIAFGLDMFLLFTFLDILLLKYFHGKHFFRILPMKQLKTFFFTSTTLAYEPFPMTVSNTKLSRVIFSVFMELDMI
jgi:hypothetical protein